MARGPAARQWSGRVPPGSRPQEAGNDSALCVRCVGTGHTAHFPLVVGRSASARPDRSAHGPPCQRAVIVQPPQQQPLFLPG